MFAAVRQNAVEEWIQALEDERMKTFSFPPSYPIWIKVDKYKLVAPFLDAVLIPRDHH